MAKISDEKYEELRLILKEQKGLSYAFEEIKEIGDGLLDFYEFLIQLEDEDKSIAGLAFK